MIQSYKQTGLLWKRIQSFDLQFLKNSNLNLFKSSILSVEELFLPAWHWNVSGEHKTIMTSIFTEAYPWLCCLLSPHTLTCGGRERDVLEYGNKSQAKKHNGGTYENWKSIMASRLLQWILLRTHTYFPRMNKKQTTTISHRLHLTIQLWSGDNRWSRRPYQLSPHRNRG